MQDNKVLPISIKVDLEGYRGFNVVECDLEGNHNKCTLSYCHEDSGYAIQTYTEPTMKENFNKMWEFVQRNKLYEDRVFSSKEISKMI